MCQSCVDNEYLSQKTYDAISTFLDKYPSAEFGPAHIVLSDSNVLDEHIKWSLGLTKAALSKDAKDLYKPEDVETMNAMEWYQDEDPLVLKATQEFLEQLLTIPEDVR